MTSVIVAAIVIVLGLVLALCIGIARSVIVSVLSGEVKGLLQDYLERNVREAAKLLPPEIAGDVENEWLAELGAIADRPITALRFARGLRAAGLDMAGEIGLSTIGSDDALPLPAPPAAEAQPNLRYREIVWVYPKPGTKAKLVLVESASPFSDRARRELAQMYEAKGQRVEFYGERRARRSQGRESPAA